MQRAGVKTASLALVALAASMMFPLAEAATPRCKGRVATKVGNARANRIRGTRRADVIVGLGGNDTIRSLGGNDIVCGGLGGDQIDGGPGADMLVGDAGGDLVVGSGAGDSVLGAAGADLLFGVAGNDRIFGGGGFDQLLGQAGNDDFDGGTGGDIAVFALSRRGVNANLATRRARGEGTDRLRAIEGLIGSGRGDTLTGNRNSNLLLGFPGGDTLNGGAGLDIASFVAAQQGVTADLTLGTATGEGNDELRNVEGLEGSDLRDTLTGDDAARNLLIGNGRADTMSGLARNDFLFGLAGVDTLDGGAGAQDICDEDPANEVNCEANPPVARATERLIKAAGLVGSMMRAPGGLRGAMRLR